MSFIKLIILTQNGIFLYDIELYFTKNILTHITWSWKNLKIHDIYIYMLSNFIFNVKLFDIKFNVNVVCNIYLHEIQN